MTTQTNRLWEHPDPFVIDIQVRREDLDELGHTNNVAYLKWLERVAWAHSISLGLDWAAYQRLGVACVVRRHELDYLAATHAGDKLGVATWVRENDGRLSMWRGYQILRYRDGATVLEGSTHFVCVRLDSGRPCRMPAEFVEGYKVS